jgi:hypothetical protein
MILSRKINFSIKFGPWAPFRIAGPSIILPAPPLSSALKKKTVLLDRALCAV